ncbi:site-specific integrase [Actinacidiphila soli]|uniref:site-specific integrase n=1 Tax=Actinacidiphila soli TaxID=2487275 RepID=UPI0019D0B7A0|nr:site-specific integrase [Actinacidiphila soli]
MILLPRPSGTVPLIVAVDRFLGRFRDDPGTRATYAETLARLRALVGDDFPTGELSCEVYGAVMARWYQRAANSWNKRLSALNSFAAYARRQDWLTTDPGRHLERGKVTRGRDKAILVDMVPATGRGRLSYLRVEYLLKQASKLHDPHGKGYTLHQLRHSGLKHLAEKGRSAPELQAKSRHTSGDAGPLRQAR